MTTKSNGKAPESTVPEQPVKPQVKQNEEKKSKALEQLEQKLVAKDKEIEVLKGTSSTSNADIALLSESLEKAVNSYRSMVIKAHPEIPEDLIKGKTVEDIDTALAGAKKIVSQVRKSLEQEGLMADVPVGAPTRKSENTDGLSPREKIQYAIGGNY